MRTGRIFNIENKVYINIEESPKGFACIKVKDRWYSATKLIWEAFNGPLKDGEKVTTKDRNRMNVKLENLEVFIPKKELKIEDFYEVFAAIHESLVTISDALQGKSTQNKGDNKEFEV